MANDKVEVWMRVTKYGTLPADLYDQRIRLIYPDGKVEWGNGEENEYDNSCFADYYPCWHPTLKYLTHSLPHKVKSPPKESLIKAMKAYDEQRGFKTIKIGEV